MGKLKFTMEPVSKIYFLNNPYPSGHKISTSIWSSRIDKDQFMGFEFHLKTENYYANTEKESEDLPAWDSKSIGKLKE
ncbi:hypothetical protein [Chryseobacterium sp. JV558]|uniref:hypothetical protein n=1 Tax=Chryseobacterium sp. JV558 TaxID=2663236 RepID=UPI00299F005D|nr:hypothetical protein [Chryseobacterium sp. JV558]MDW9382449.1 hypothetical protein [Chryseobacterium sp. JV558]